MARPPSSRKGYQSLSYFIRKPSSFAIWFLLFAGGSFLFWDRRGLVRQHDAQVAKLVEEKDRLLRELQELEVMSSRKEEEILEGKDSHDFDSVHFDEHFDAEDREEKPESKEEDQDDRHAPILDRHDALDGLNDAPADPDPITKERRNKVRAAMIHAWRSYEKYAWGFDELLPMSQRGSNNFGGLGASIVDALDTLYIMGLHDEFEKATEWVSTSLDFNKHYSASVFETTIRVLGGLLSSYDLSGKKIFLTKAQELADRLLPAWNTETGIPLNSIDLASGSASNPHWTAGSNLLADLGTEQIEFIALSQRTGIPKYAEKVEKVVLKMREILPADGLLPIYINSQTGRPTNQKITFGAMGDSFYEYLLKVWIQGNKTEVVRHYREMWEQSMEGLKTLVKKSTPSSYVYLAERNGGTVIDKMDELACFAPGMLTLGADGANPTKAKEYLEIAEGLARTCYNFYMSTRTHLAGENYHFAEGRDMSVGTSYNILRPETIESLFYLWRKTGDSKYRDWAWDIFEAFESYSRVPTGYVGLRDVNSGEKDDTMQSFFLAETLKYLYLLFSPSSVIPLDEWVFNTEAHPVRILTRNPALEYHDSQTGEGKERKQNLSGRSSLPNRIMRGGSNGGSFDYS
ncbi:unnamed protein product [Calypogeia fissa]